METLLILAKGVGGLKSDLINNWIGPAFLIAVAALSVKFLMDREFRKLAGFILIAAIVGVFIFAGDTLFGSNGIFKKMAEDSASKLNMIQYLRYWI